MDDSATATDGERPCRVLYVDADADDADALRTRLERSDADLAVQTVQTAEGARRRLAEAAVDCLLVGGRLPDDDPVSLIRRVRETDPDLPIVLYTDRGSEELASDAVGAGVSDYVPRDGRGVDALLARVRDAVEEARAERHARRDSARIGEIQARISDAFYAVDDEWRVTEWNDQMAARTGVDADDVVGDVVWDHFPELRGSTLHDRYRQAVETGEPVTVETHLGELGYWVEVRAFPAEDGLWVFSRDVTDRVERERELERERRRFEAVFTDTADAMVITDAEMVITDVNPAAERLFGYDAAELVGEDVERLYADEVAYDHAVERAAESGRTPVVARYRRADGTTVEGETAWTPLRTTDGGDVVALGVIRDVSDRLEREDDLLGRSVFLRRFTEITTDESAAFDEQVRQLLTLCTRRFGLEVGVFGVVEDGTYRVRTAVSPDDAVVEGDAHPVSDTVCAAVAERRDVVAFVDGDGPSNCHPAYPDYAVEAYLGAPVVVDGDVYGTLGFSSPRPRTEPIPAYERTLVRLLAQWVGRELGRKRSKRRERESRRRLRQVIDLLPQFVFAKDETGEYLLANEALADAYGTTPAEMEGSRDVDFVEDEAQASRFRADDRAVIESGEVRHIPEERLTTADGETRLLETRKIPFDDGSGDAVLGVASDVTRLKERERALERLYTTARDLMTGHNVTSACHCAVETAEKLGFDVSGVHLHDGEALSPVAWSAGAAETFGQHPPRYTDDSSVVWEAFESGEPVVIEDTTTFGGRLPSDTVARSALVLPLGDHGVFITSSPETADFDDADYYFARLLAAATETALDRVEREDELRDRERELEERNERLDEFASVVAHDLRNPLAVAAGMVQLATETDDAAYLERASAALDRMDRLVDDLLALARAGDALDEPEPVSLREAARAAWVSVETDGAALDIVGGEAGSAGGEATIRADEGRLAQLLENLFRNSVEHGSTDGERCAGDDGTRGAADVTVRVGAFDGGFFVEDDGPGIPVDDRRRVLERGFTTDPTGTGFGLSIVADVADAHGWTTSVTESASGGARFEFRYPDGDPSA